MKQQRTGRTNLAGVTKPLGESVAIYRRHKALRPGKCPHIYQGLRPLSSTELGPFILSDMLYLAVWVSLMGAGDQCQDGKFPHPADHGTTWDSLKRTHPRLFRPNSSVRECHLERLRAARRAACNEGSHALLRQEKRQAGGQLSLPRRTWHGREV